MSLYSNDDPISLELPVFSSNREAVIENNLVIPIPDGFISHKIRRLSAQNAH